MSFENFAKGFLETIPGSIKTARKEAKSEKEKLEKRAHEERQKQLAFKQFVSMVQQGGLNIKPSLSGSGDISYKTTSTKESKQESNPVEEYIKTRQARENAERAFKSSKSFLGLMGGDQNLAKSIEVYKKSEDELAKKALKDERYSDKMRQIMSGYSSASQPQGQQADVGGDERLSQIIQQGFNR